MNPSIVKRCLVGAVLAIAATLPGFQQLHTSVEGLKLIADYEGCRLQPYQCSAGVWTDGIGNTSGVIPGKNNHGTTGSRRADFQRAACGAGTGKVCEATAAAKGV
ncbi:glycoside hydrolase family protein [Escherichia coli]|nr:glycoside hydrolase family protein [Escherichia coli]